jgi:hypothetical protein
MLPKYNLQFHLQAVNSFSEFCTFTLPVASVYSRRKRVDAGLWVRTPCGLIGRYQRRNVLPPSSTLKLKAVCSSETALYLHGCYK